MPTHWIDLLGLHEIILYLVIILLVAAFGGGPLLRALFNWLLKIFGRGVSETIINVGTDGGEMAKKIPVECVGCGLAVDPSKCVMHQSEHERSLRNEDEIKKIWEQQGKIRDEATHERAQMRQEMSFGFKEVTASINASNNQILSALAGTRNGFERPGRGGVGG